MNLYFSENVRRLRKERDLTQEALADFLGVSFQAVSKWERGESYPDIELLPTVADFFSVSVDELLGVDQAKKEAEILAILDKYDNGKYKGTDGAFGFMTEAYKKYPNDFRIAVRYMMELVNDIDFEDDPDAHKKEIIGLFNRIQNFCTNDRIRIRSKFLIIHYYTLFIVNEKKSDVSMADVIALIETMPRITDSKEMMMSYIPVTKEEIQSGCRSLIEEVLCILDNTVNRYCTYHYRVKEKFTEEDARNAIGAFEMMNHIFDLFYPDGNYGRNWRYVIYNYGHLGDLYQRIGSDEKALENLRKCAELAKHFDTMPNLTERHGLFFEGQTLNKQEQVNVKLDTSVCTQMTHHMLDNYPLSAAFKAKPEFQEIIHIME